MTNMTFDEWSAHLAVLANDLRVQFPRLQIDVKGSNLNLQVRDTSFGVSANIDLRGGQREGSMEPHAAFGGGPAIAGSPSTIEMLIQDTRLILDALHVAVAHTEQHAVWGRNCPCDRCRGSGKDMRDATCEICNGVGTRNDPTE